ncbi:MAG: hypothetical protein PHT40_02290 [Patescibacteria group bacterium]|nr:hypothetical protein [Patescibacteria group bacterium]
MESIWKEFWSYYTFFDLFFFLVGLSLIGLAGLLTKQAVYTIRDENNCLSRYLPQHDVIQKKRKEAYWKIFGAVTTGLVGTAILTSVFCPKP